MAPHVFLKACSFHLFKTRDVILVPFKDTAGQLGAESAIQWMVLCCKTSSEPSHEVEAIKMHCDLPWSKPGKNWSYNYTNEKQGELLHFLRLNFNH